MKFLVVIMTLSILLMDTAVGAAKYTPPKKGGPASSSGSGTRFILDVDRSLAAF